MARPVEAELRKDRTSDTKIQVRKLSFLGSITRRSMGDKMRRRRGRNVWDLYHRFNRTRSFPPQQALLAIPRYFNVGAVERFTDTSARESEKAMTTSFNRAAKAAYPMASISLAFAAPAQAEQPQTITISSKVAPWYKGGQLIGCQLGFEVARNDPEYSGGDLAYLTGTLAFAAFEGKDLSFNLKLGTSTIQAQGAFTAPSDAYLVDGYRTNAADFLTSFEGEPGFRLFAYSVGTATQEAAMRRIIQDQMFTFAYAMQPGGTNAVVEVDLTVEQLDLNDPSRSSISEKNSNDWNDCLGAAMNAAQERLVMSMSDEELLKYLDENDNGEHSELANSVDEAESYLTIEDMEAAVEAAADDAIAAAESEE